MEGDLVLEQNQDNQLKERENALGSFSIGLHVEVRTRNMDLRSLLSEKRPSARKGWIGRV
jgi:hypothetical protein